MEDGRLGARADGVGFDRDALTPEEVARLRHTLHIIWQLETDPTAIVLMANPKAVARHLAIGALHQVSVFLRDNKAVVGGAIVVAGAVKWETVAQIATALAGILQ